MPLLPALLLMAQGVLSEQVEVPILHTRPSKIVKIFGKTPGRGISVEGVVMRANDVEGTITLVGSRSGIDETKARIALFDNRPRKARIAVSISAPLNHANWNGEIETFNNIEWNGDDGATGVKLSLAPRINDDGTCTAFVKLKSEDAVTMSVVFRLKLNQEQSIQMKAPGIRPANATPKWVPTIKLKYLGDGTE